MNHTFQLPTGHVFMTTFYRTYFEKLKDLNESDPNLFHRYVLRAAMEDGPWSPRDRSALANRCLIGCDGKIVESIRQIILSSVIARQGGYELVDLTDSAGGDSFSDPGSFDALPEVSDPSLQNDPIEFFRAFHRMRIEDPEGYEDLFQAAQENRPWIGTIFDSSLFCDEEGIVLPSVRDFLVKGRFGNVF